MKEQFDEPTNAKRKKTCYAHVLGNCSQKMSKEHFVSKGLLKRILRDGEATFSGFPWQSNAEPACLSLSSLQSRVLCVHHNNELSKLDDVAIEFDQIFMEMICHLTESDSNDSFIHCIDGSSFERWMIKVTCGLFASGNVGEQGRAVPKSVPPAGWLNSLFGLSPVPQPFGLYLSGIVGNNIRHSFAVRPLGDGRRVIGCIARTNMLQFILIMGTPDYALVEVLEKAVFRPCKIEFTHFPRNRNATIELKWNDAIDHGAVQIALTDEIEDTVA